MDVNSTLRVLAIVVLGAATSNVMFAIVIRIVDYWRQRRPKPIHPIVAFYEMPRGHERFDATDRRPDC